VAYEAAHRVACDVEGLEGRMRWAEEEWGVCSWRAQQVVATTGATSFDEVILGVPEWKVAQEGWARTVAEWDQWRQAYPHLSVDSTLEPLAGGVLGMLFSAVGGGGGGGGAAAAAARTSLVESACLTARKLRNTARELKLVHKDAEEAQEGAKSTRMAAVKDAQRAEKELEVSGPRKVEQAEAAAKKEGDALAAAEAKLALASEAGGGPPDRSLLSFLNPRPWPYTLDPKPRTLNPKP